MAKRFALSLIAVLTISLLCTNARAQKANSVLGTWEGESICTVRPSPCHDEHVIYEISRIENSDRLTIAMDKVVAGERQYMGSLECQYQPGHLLCHYRNDHWDYVVKGQKMTGTLTLSDGRLYRRISARKK